MLCVILRLAVSDLWWTDRHTATAYTAAAYRCAVIQLRRFSLLSDRNARWPRRMLPRHMLPLMSGVEYAPRALLRLEKRWDRQADRQETDERTPDRCITLAVRCGQRKLDQYVLFIRNLEHNSYYLLIQTTSKQLTWKAILKLHRKHLTNGVLFQV